MVPRNLYNFLFARSLCYEIFCIRIFFLSQCDRVINTNKTQTEHTWRIYYILFAKKNTTYLCKYSANIRSSVRISAKSWQNKMIFEFNHIVLYNTYIYISTHTGTCKNDILWNALSHNYRSALYTIDEADLQDQDWQSL